MDSLLHTTLGLTEDTLAQAQANLSNGTAYFLVVSGKQGSGKDTVAPIVLAELGYVDAAHLYYALPLKDECDAIIALLRTRFGTDVVPRMTPKLKLVVADVVSEHFNIPTDQAHRLTRDLVDAVRADPHLHSRMRTPEIRTALQYLGTDIRRAQDDNYWVSRALRPAFDTLALGQSVFFTDGRFDNEITVAQSLGATAIRLDITPETQRARLMARDGIEPDFDTLNHKSETALDDFEDFDARVNNEGPLEDVIAGLIEQLGHRQRLLAAS